jgi:hypothetical protein
MKLGTIVKIRRHPGIYEYGVVSSVPPYPAKIKIFWFGYEPRTYANARLPPCYTMYFSKDIQELIKKEIIKIIK